MKQSYKNNVLLLRTKAKFK